MSSVREREPIADQSADDIEVVRELVELLLDRRRADKDLGQHYLVDPSVIHRSIELAELDSDSHVLEVGPGSGTLTHFLMEAGSKVTAIELDQVAVEHLHRVHPDAIEDGRLNLIEGDALKVGWPRGLTHVVSNPPYQISSPLITKIDEYQAKARALGDEPLRSVTLLLQEEFTSRMGMEFGLASRGPLGINLAINWVSTLDRTVSAGSFTPHPRVRSRLVHLVPFDLMADMGVEVDSRLVKRMVDHAFLERRKKVRNRMKGTPRKIERVPGWTKQEWRRCAKELLAVESIEGVGSDWSEVRPEELEVEEWVLLAGELERIRQN